MGAWSAPSFTSRLLISSICRGRQVLMLRVEWRVTFAMGSRALRAVGTIAWSLFDLLLALWLEAKMLRALFDVNLFPPSSSISRSSGSD